MGVSDDEAQYEPVMRFVTTKDNGGPHDSESYVCGYEMGALDAALGVMRGLGFRTHLTQLHTANQPQADLLAMKHRVDVSFHVYDECPEWMEVEFALGAVEPLDGEQA